MSKDVLRARSALANLHNNGNTPTQSELDAARANLCCAKLDAEIRRSVAAAGTAMNGIQVAHLVGLLLMSSGTDDQSIDRCARSIREAVYVTPNLTSEDRAAIAQLVLGSRSE